MAKDPAFLFYSSDFLTGTMFLSHEQVGIYIRLLCSQHQHGGLIKPIDFDSMIGQHDILRAKFVKTESGYFNERLATEMENRAKKSSNLSEAAKEIWAKRKEKPQINTKVKQKHYNRNAKVIQPEDENEDENENTVVIECEIKNEVKGEKTLFQKCIAAYDDFIQKQTGAKAKIDGQQGKAMNSIIAYLKIQDKISGDESKALQAWRWILDNFGKLDAFNGSQLKISQINSNIVNILNQLKNGNPKQNGSSRRLSTDDEIHEAALRAVANNK